MGVIGEDVIEEEVFSDDGDDSGGDDNTAEKKKKKLKISPTKTAKKDVTAKKKSMLNPQIKITIKNGKPGKQKPANNN